MAIPNYGTNSVLDTLAANTQTIAQIGEDRAWEAIQMSLNAHNRIVGELKQSFVEPTTDRLRRYGVSASMGMDEMVEFGTPDAQKIPPGVVVGFPLRKYGGALQWTRTYFARIKGSELAAQVTGLMDADVVNIYKQIQRAVYAATNFTTIDKLVDYVTSIPIPVKAFVNADSLGLPPGPNGETFDGTTHNHYLGAASAGTLADADLTALQNTVNEHYASGKGIFVINQAQEAAFRAFTPNFQQFYDPTIVVGANVTYARGSLDTIQLYNRKIGTYRGAEVWVRPWALASYVFYYLEGAPKPIAWRMDPALPDDLTLTFEDEAHPLRCRVYERNFGMGVWNRTNGAVLDVAHTTYNVPTIAR
jgi:hypothetical protein